MRSYNGFKALIFFLLKYMGRYSDINRGPELQDAYEKYQLWLKKPRKDKKAAYKLVAKSEADRVKTERVAGFILPFNSENEKVYLEARIVSNAQTGAGTGTAAVVRGLVSSRVFETMPTGTDIYSLKVRRFQFAKIIASQRTTTATTETDSRITDTPYKRHRSDNVSSPFGRSGGTDTYSDALQAIKTAAAYKTFVGQRGNRIGFSPEGD